MVTAVALAPATLTAHAAGPPAGLAAFLDPQGRTRYAGDVADLVDYAQANGYRVDPAAVQVYAVPTVEGIVRYVTDRPQDFGISPNDDRTVVVPGDDAVAIARAVERLGTDLTVLPDRVVVTVSRETTVQLMIEDGAVDPELAAANVFNVVPLANASVVVNSQTSLTSADSQPLYQPVDAFAGVMPDGSGKMLQRDDREKPEWHRNNDACFLASTSAWYRRVCWTIDNQISDESSDYVFWQFGMEASSYGKERRGMFRTWVEGAPQHNNDTAMDQWFDGQHPRPAQQVGGTEGCSQVSEGTSLSGGSPIQLGKTYSFSVTTCETYSPKGYDDDGHYATIWNFNHDRDESGVGHAQRDPSMRQVAFTMGVKTRATEKGPGWWLYSGTHVEKHCCG